MSWPVWVKPNTRFSQKPRPQIAHRQGRQHLAGGRDDKLREE
jgi:hypothetical protein